MRSSYCKTEGEGRGRVVKYWSFTFESSINLNVSELRFRATENCRITLALRYSIESEKVKPTNFEFSRFSRETYLSSVSHPLRDVHIKIIFATVGNRCFAL